MEQKPNRNSSAGTAADSDMQPIVLSSSPTFTKTTVNCRFWSNDKKKKMKIKWKIKKSILLLKNF